MPDPHTWRLTYPALTEEQQHTCRLHFSLLAQDVHVASVTLTESTNSPFVFEIRVEFGSNFEQPRNPEIRALDRRFPERLDEHFREVIAFRQVMETATRLPPWFDSVQAFAVTRLNMSQPTAERVRATWYERLDAEWLDDD